PPALSTESGVAMNVFDGQSTVSPRTPTYSSTASAVPDQFEKATAGSPFQPSQASSNSRVSSPSDHRSSAKIRSQSSRNRARSRRSTSTATITTAARLLGMAHPRLRSVIGGRGFLLLPAAAFAVHQLRYSLAYGSRANQVLAMQGHSYLNSLAPWLVLLLGLG